LIESHPSADLAFRIVKDAHEMIQSSKSKTIKNLNLNLSDSEEVREILECTEPLPRVTKYVSDPIRQGFIQLINLSLKLDARMTIKSRTTTTTLSSVALIKKMKLIEKAWTERDADGTMRIEGSAMNVRTVRYKNEELWTRGPINVSVYSEKNTETGNCGYGIRFKSERLEDALCEARESKDYGSVVKEINMLMKVGDAFMQTLNAGK